MTLIKMLVKRCEPTLVMTYYWMEKKDYEESK